MLCSPESVDGCEFCFSKEVNEYEQESKSKIYFHVFSWGVSSVPQVCNGAFLGLILYAGVYIAVLPHRPTIPVSFFSVPVRTLRAKRIKDPRGLPWNDVHNAFAALSCRTENTTCVESSHARRAAEVSEL